MIYKKFGQLTALEPAASHKLKSKKTGKFSCRERWTCECSCGLRIIVDGTKLRRGTVTKCRECAYRLRPQSIRRKSVEQRLFNLVIKRRKGFKISLTLDEFIYIIKQNCHYCGRPPRKIEYLYKNKFAKSEEIYANGVDRVDSNGGYEFNNCVPCCKKCNTAKNTMNPDEFIEWIIEVYNYNNVKIKKGA